MNKFFWGYYQRKVLLEYAIRKNYIDVKTAQEIMFYEGNRRGLLEIKLKENKEKLKKELKENDKR